MLNSVAPESLTLRNDANDAFPTLLQRLRIARNKNHPIKQRQQLLPPFRRRTESVNTVMSSNSMTDNTYDVTSPVAIPMKLETPKQSCSVFDWLENECPSDIVPKILAFCGPQQVSALSKTNRHWNTVVRQEQTWRVMCEELYKVRMI
jgi:hypothetical protein